MKIIPAAFEGQSIRRVYDEKADTWLFSVVDIIQVPTQQPDFQAARNYWKVLKNRLKNEGSQSVTNCNRLKLPAADGKSYLTDVANPETLLHRNEADHQHEQAQGRKVTTRPVLIFAAQ